MEKPSLGCARLLDGRLGRDAFRTVNDGLRSGHDAGQIRIIVRAERSALLAIGMPLLTALGLLLLPLLPKNFFLALLGSVFRTRSHAWSTSAASDRRRIRRDRHRRRHHRRRIHRDRHRRRRRIHHGCRRHRRRRLYAHAPR